MNSTYESLYFEYRPNSLDVETQRERWFGAVWAYRDGKRIVQNYWFEDTQAEVWERWKSSEWYTVCTVLFMPYPIDMVYEQVKQHQVTMLRERGF